MNPEVMDAISRAIVRASRSDQPWHVCVRKDDELLTFRLGSYKEVEQLAQEVRGLGYRLTMMHPVHTHCDFVLELDAQP